MKISRIFSVLTIIFIAGDTLQTILADYAPEKMDMEDEARQAMMLEPRSFIPRPGNNFPGDTRSTVTIPAQTEADFSGAGQPSNKDGDDVDEEEDEGSAASSGDGGVAPSKVEDESQQGEIVQSATDPSTNFTAPSRNLSSTSGQEQVTIGNQHIPEIVMPRNNATTRPLPVENVAGNTTANNQELGDIHNVTLTQKSSALHSVSEPNTNVTFSNMKTNESKDDDSSENDTKSIDNARGKVEFQDAKIGKDSKEEDIDRTDDENESGSGENEDEVPENKQQVTDNTSSTIDETQGKIDNSYSVGGTQTVSTSEEPNNVVPLQNNGANIDKNDDDDDRVDEEDDEHDEHDDTGSGEAEHEHMNYQSSVNQTNHTLSSTKQDKDYQPLVENKPIKNTDDGMEEEDEEDDEDEDEDEDEDMEDAIKKEEDKNREIDEHEDEQRYEEDEETRKAGRASSNESENIHQPQSSQESTVHKLQNTVDTETHNTGEHDDNDENKELQANQIPERRKDNQNALKPQKQQTPQTSTIHKVQKGTNILIKPAVTMETDKVAMTTNNSTRSSKEAHGNKHSERKHNKTKKRKNFLKYIHRPNLHIHRQEAAKVNKTLPHKCDSDDVKTGYSLKGGTRAGHVDDLGGSANMHDCIKRCCTKHACDVALLLDGRCFGVACYSKELCEPIRVPHPHYVTSQIAFLNKAQRRGEVEKASPEFDCKYGELTIRNNHRWSGELCGGVVSCKNGVISVVKCPGVPKRPTNCANPKLYVKQRPGQCCIKKWKCKDKSCKFGGRKIPHGISLSDQLCTGVVTCTNGHLKVKQCPEIPTKPTKKCANPRLKVTTIPGKCCKQRWICSDKSCTYDKLKVDNGERLTDASCAVVMECKNGFLSFKKCPDPPAIPSACLNPTLQVKRRLGECCHMKWACGAK